MENRIFPELRKNSLLLDNKNQNIIETNNHCKENCINIRDIITFISLQFSAMIRKNEKLKKKPKKGINEPFYSKLIPSLSLEKFLIRIIKYTEADSNVLIAAYLYILKLIETENFILSVNNIYRLLLGSVVLAEKVLTDLTNKNSYYCEIGGISLQELNNIELSLFERLNYKINPKKEQIDNVYKTINEFVCLKTNNYVIDRKN